MFTGQVCVATKRIYVHESIYEPFLKALVDATTKMKVGSAYNSDTVIGPLQNKMQYDNVQELVDDSKNCGYKFALGLQATEATKGYIIHPCIVDNPPEDSRIVVEEQFGKNTDPTAREAPANPSFQHRSDCAHHEVYRGV